MRNRRLHVVVADDEPIARRGLERLVAGESDVGEVHACENGLDALAAIREHAPDVALLDIAMPGMSGVDVVRALGAGARPAIVFVTAFDQYAIDAFDLHAVDYLLKPFDEPRFRTAFQRVRERLHARDTGDAAARLDALLEVLAKRPAAADRLAVKDGHKVVVVPTADIVWCEAQDNYVRIHATTGRHFVRLTLRALVDKLDPRKFARIHRSFVVNLSRVRELRPMPSGDYQALLSDGTKLTLSRSYRDAVLDRMNC